MGIHIITISWALMFIMKLAIFPAWNIYIAIVIIEQWGTF